MSKIAEKKALEEYPLPKEESESTAFINQETFNVSKRTGYIKGYDQATQDFLEKACEWLKHAEGYIITSEGGDSSIDCTLFIEDFKNHMQDE